MSDLIKQLRNAARKSCERHNNVDQFDPTWARKPTDFIVWNAADEIERLLMLGKIQADRLNEALVEIERLEAALNAVYHHAPINPEYGYQGVDADAMFFIAKKALAKGEQ